MTEFGIWDESQGGFIDTQLYSRDTADAQLEHWKTSYRAQGEAPEVLTVVEVCSEHEEQPADDCDECAAEESAEEADAS